jgi:hypothetical protein
LIAATTCRGARRIAVSGLVALLVLVLLLVALVVVALLLELVVVVLELEPLLELVLLILVLAVAACVRGGAGHLLDLGGGVLGDQVDLVQQHLSRIHERTPSAA